VIPSYSRNISTFFYGDEFLCINRAVHDCGIEGAANSAYKHYNEFAFNYSSISTCLNECNTEDGCFSCTYDYGVRERDCRMYYQWDCGVGDAGKTGYKCVDNRPFGS
jgi:hypothetical protein